MDMDDQLHQIPAIDTRVVEPINRAISLGQIATTANVTNLARLAFGTQTVQAGLVLGYQARFINILNLIRQHAIAELGKPIATNLQDIHWLDATIRFYNQNAILAAPNIVCCLFAS